jgi:hypothetical protein
MSDDSGEENERLRALIEANVRPGNSFWAWRDKPIGERGAASQILQQAGVEVVDLVSRPVGDDPPDCEGMLDGQWSGVEVTELVHEKTLKRSIKAFKERAVGCEPEQPEAYFMWDRDTLLIEVQRLIDAKDVARLKGGPYDRYVLVIHSDEFLLNSTFVSQALQGATFRANLITDVFIGLSYEPRIGPDGGQCPVFRLDLTTR